LGESQEAPPKWAKALPRRAERTGHRGVSKGGKETKDPKRKGKGGQESATQEERRVTLAGPQSLVLKKFSPASPSAFAVGKRSASKLRGRVKNGNEKRGSESKWQRSRNKSTKNSLNKGEDFFCGREKEGSVNFLRFSAAIA